jgi:Ethanolamine utilization protein EutJ (predicted chaperonin)
MFPSSERFINHSQVNDANIKGGSSSQPLPFEPKQALHVGQPNHILFMPQLSAVPSWYLFFFQTSQLCCLEKEIIIIV